MNAQKIVKSKCRKIYGDVQKFFATNDIQPKFWFKILNAPPKYKLPILFIGFQPGGREEDADYETARGSHLHWPAEVEYVTAEWLLAQKMRDMFGV